MIDLINLILLIVIIVLAAMVLKDIKYLKASGKIYTVKQQIYFSEKREAAPDNQRSRKAKKQYNDYTENDLPF